ncbi:L,D-transpeptidase family protein [Acidithiobacillus thiooxidans]|uniref:Putative L,D-transpeptidase ErfK/SrfK n=1 Tax=Acidithiobacillus thiooxidans ATCC 19377 TaxID=637390 RepID=A0A543Q510_ACITH|nr:L,D-transpeptidase family protein [Acidithiobacillus thiooxidans]MDR7926953.1 L,D-transpeptidase family protein [Acidithiobacillus thiooxidans]MDX5934497.1 L,D-transpeptidase family protein [Acidithiobacillus thiooxidans]TQN51388.1 putative L,D-transpeptidase ErfK/SrfK [Acidithiobacillus thiooxidans ATCC 19377]
MKQKQWGIWLLTAALSALGVGVTQASVFALPEHGNVVGTLHAVTTHRDDTLLDIGRFYDLGYNQVTKANPGVNPWLPGQASKVVIPAQYVLPPKPWTGIVVDIPARRIYFFPNNDHVVYTYPVGVFLPGWKENLTTTQIIAKFKMPAWNVPKNIHSWFKTKFHMDIPWYWPPGPENPMGELAMETGLSGIFIHGTYHPWGVGMRSSQGCFQMFPENVAQLFPMVPVGTPVRIIDMPNLVGVHDGEVYLQSYKPLDTYHKGVPELQRAAMRIKDFMAENHIQQAIDWSKVRRIVGEHNTVALPIGVNSPSYQTLAAAVPARPYAYAPYGPSANGAAVPAPLKLAKPSDREHLHVQVSLPDSKDQ